MGKIAVKYGAIAGAVLSVMMLLTLRFHDAIGFERGAVIGYTSMVLAFLMVYFGVRAYREEVAGGRVSFGRALVVGLLITGVATTCYVATWEVIYYGLAPDFAQEFADHAIEKARASGASAGEVAEQARRIQEFQEMYRNPLVNIAFTFLEPLPVGLLFTFVAAGLLSRKQGAGPESA